MKRIKEFIKDHGISTTIIGCSLTALFVFIASAFGYVARDADIKARHTIQIEHLTHTDTDIKKLIERIEPKLINIQLDVREIKTTVNNMKDDTE